MDFIHTTFRSIGCRIIRHASLFLSCSIQRSIAVCVLLRWKTPRCVYCVHLYRPIQTKYTQILLYILEYWMSSSCFCIWFSFSRILSLFHCAKVNRVISLWTLLVHIVLSVRYVRVCVFVFFFLSGGQIREDDRYVECLDEQILWVIESNAVDSVILSIAFNVYCMCEWMSVMYIYLYMYSWKDTLLYGTKNIYNDANRRKERERERTRK